MNKPTVKLIGTDGNAFALLGQCMKVARKAGWTQEQIKEFYTKSTAGNYDDLLCVIADYFDIV